MQKLLRARVDLLAQIKTNPKDERAHEELSIVEGALLRMRETTLRIPPQTKFFGFAWE